MPSRNLTSVSKSAAHELRTGCLFILPLVVFIVLFVLLPVLGTFINSMFQDVSFVGKRFYFFKNYEHLWSDPGFFKALKFTLLFILVSVPFELVLGLLFAMLLDQHIPFRGLLRGCVLIPWAIPAAISARTWELIYNYSYGLANYICLTLGLSTQPVNWLGTSVGAFSAVVVADVWKTAPFVAIIFLAGLQAIPRELYEQGRIDRANSWHMFFRITLPILRPVVIVALLFRTIDGLRVFDLIYVLTHGGPGGSTASVSHYAYMHFVSGDFGYGSAISVVLFVIAFVFSIVYVKVGRFSTEVL
ncbi:MAG: ABC transporter permease subunit [Actinobacteria bacterium]|nr:ABC transporter permease subunit [Actinomycetota bacterium]